MITENETTITPTNYTPPVYRKIAAQNLFFKIYDDTHMVVVCNLAGGEFSKVEPYPTTRFAQIKDTTSSTSGEFNAARIAVHATLLAL